MEIAIKKVTGSFVIKGNENTAFLQADTWDDFGHNTLFHLSFVDAQGVEQVIGDVKIASVGQKEGSTSEHIPNEFKSLSDEFYSVGQDANYYTNLIDCLSREVAITLLKSLGDIAYDEEKFQKVVHEETFQKSFLRTVNFSSIQGQFRRIVSWEVPLTEFDFGYKIDLSKDHAGFQIDFRVKPNSVPPTNVHVLIGRNGVGKTTLLNNMAGALINMPDLERDPGRFYSQEAAEKDLSETDYFAGVVSVSFSAFDPFEPPADQREKGRAIKYSYVGLKSFSTVNGLKKWYLKDKDKLCEEFTTSLSICFSLTAKRERWVSVVEKLETDSSFSEMNLASLAEEYLIRDQEQKDVQKDIYETAGELYSQLSSGQAIVLLTITRLVEIVEEKTLVLLDEPESHLHPPLLSAFTRALSDLLTNRNGIAIIATHSPVVLQEVPRTCVSILQRIGLDAKIERPETETFAESLGVLTREVFGLEVMKSGFYSLLLGRVDGGASYQEILAEFGNQIGFEGRSMLRAILADKEGNWE